MDIQTQLNDKLTTVIETVADIEDVFLEVLLVTPIPDLARVGSPENFGSFPLGFQIALQSHPASLDSCHNSRPVDRRTLL